MKGPPMNEALRIGSLGQGAVRQESEVKKAEKPQRFCPRCGFSLVYIWHLDKAGDRHGEEAIEHYKCPNCPYREYL